MYVFSKCHVCNTFICIYHNCRCRRVQPAVQSEGLAPTRLPSLQIPTVNSGVPTTTIRLNNLLEWLTELSEVLYLVSWFYNSESLWWKPAKGRDAQDRGQEEPGIISSQLPRVTLHRVLPAGAAPPSLGCPEFFWGLTFTLRAFLEVQANTGSEPIGCVPKSPSHITLLGCRVARAPDRQTDKDTPIRQDIPGSLRSPSSSWGRRPVLSLGKVLHYSVEMISTLHLKKKKKTLW